MKPMKLAIAAAAVLVASCGGSAEGTCFVAGCDSPATTSLTYRHTHSYPMGPPADVDVSVCAGCDGVARDPESEVSAGMRERGLEPK